MRNCGVRSAIALAVALGGSLCLLGQDPAPPAKEYIRFGERTVAVEMRAAPVTGGTTIGLIPSTASLGPGQSQQFTASVTGTGNLSVTWSLSPQVGSININGLYTAPAAVSNAQSITVTATSVADPSKKATAAISFYSPGTSGYFPVSGSFLTFYRNLSPELWAKEFDHMREPT